jgi:hypothetical protein
LLNFSYFVRYRSSFSQCYLTPFITFLQSPVIITILHHCHEDDRGDEVNRLKYHML